MVCKRCGNPIEYIPLKRGTSEYIYPIDCDAEVMSVNQHMNEAMESKQLCEQCCNHYELTIEQPNPSWRGIINPPPGEYTEQAGTALTVIGVPSKDYVLDHWMLDGVNMGRSNPIIVTLDQDHTLQAIFSVGILSILPSCNSSSGAMLGEKKTEGNRNSRIKGVVEKI